MFGQCFRYLYGTVEGSWFVINIRCIFHQVSSSGQAQTLTVSGGAAMASFAGIPGFAYVVQRSTNLVDWVTLETTNAPANGLFDYTDTFGHLKCHQTRRRVRHFTAYPNRRALSIFE